MPSRSRHAFLGLISLIGLISPIAPSVLRLACPKPPKKCPFDTKIASNPHFFEKKWCDCLPIRKKVVPLHSLSETEAH